jgi:hypothetical protein
MLLVSYSSLAPFAYSPVPLLARASQPPPQLSASKLLAASSISHIIYLPDTDSSELHTILQHTNDQRIGCLLNKKQSNIHRHLTAKPITITSQSHTRHGVSITPSCRGSSALLFQNVIEARLVSRPQSPTATELFRGLLCDLPSHVPRLQSNQVPCVRRYRNMHDIRNKLLMQRGVPVTVRGRACTTCHRQRVER